MMYKDKDKQKEANRQAKERWKAKQADKFAREALGIPVEGIPSQGIPPIKDEGIPKRGKDIQCFEDLPPDVQATINRISLSPEEKARRTAIAINYQHLFPDRYYSTGVV